jgi:hypothetical protein
MEGAPGSPGFLDPDIEVEGRNRCIESTGRNRCDWVRQFHPMTTTGTGTLRDMTTMTTTRMPSAGP